LSILHGRFRDLHLNRQILRIELHENGIGVHAVVVPYRNRGHVPGDTRNDRTDVGIDLRVVRLCVDFVILDDVPSINPACNKNCRKDEWKQAFDRPFFCNRSFLFLDDRAFLGSAVGLRGCSRPFFYCCFCHNDD